MEQENKTETATDNTSDAKTSAGGWRKWGAITLVSLAAVGSIGVVGAMSNDSPRFGFMRDGGFDGGPTNANFGGHGPRHGGFGPGGLDRILEEIDATSEQEKKLWDIADSVRDEVRPVMREMRDTREKLAELLGAPTVDTAAVEALRTERLAKLDDVSKKISTALVEAANVLTPEQRAKLAEEIKDRGPGGRW